jgi:hypothetical protein
MGQNSCYPVLPHGAIWGKKREREGYIWHVSKLYKDKKQTKWGQNGLHKGFISLNIILVLSIVI